MQGAERFKEIFDKYKDDRKILLYGDPDVDGLMALKMLADYVQMFGLSYTYYVNQNRSHGFELEPEILGGYFVIAADFAITEAEMKRLVEKNVVCISIDHHVCQSEFIDIRGGSAEGIVINNQYPFEPVEDRYLSGTGVVYELFSSVTPEFKTKDHEAMVGITLLSDVRAIENQRAHKYLAKTFNHTEGYIKYLVDETAKSDYTFGAPRMDRDFIDFTFSPTVNAMLRFNMVDEAIDFIFGNGLSGEDYRVRQQELIRRMTADVEVLELGSMTVLAIDVRKYDVDITNFIGLLCSSYKNKGKSSLIFAYEGGSVVRASFRGKYDDVRYLEGFHSLGVDAEGHENAFGIRKFYPKPSLWQDLNKLIEGLEENHKDTRTIVDVVNLSLAVTSKGSKVAYENCYVRDMYRTYFRYKGKNIKEVRHTYRLEEFTQDDYYNKEPCAKEVGGIKYKYKLDEDGKRVTKYREYLVDGKIVKAFSDVGFAEGLILPILEKGYLQLYLN